MKVNRYGDVWGCRFFLALSPPRSTVKDSEPVKTQLLFKKGHVQPGKVNIPLEKTKEREKKSTRSHSSPENKAHTKLGTHLFLVSLRYLSFHPGMSLSSLVQAL